MFRQVNLPPDIKGNLYLHSMPGRHEPFSAACAEMERLGISKIVCLVLMCEIRNLSPDYADAINFSRLPCRHQSFPITDFGVPKDTAAYIAVLKENAAAIRSGDNILVHCAAGVGRTGTFAHCLLLALRVPFDEAGQRIADAGSYTEANEQEGLVAEVGRALRGDQSA